MRIIFTFKIQNMTTDNIINLIWIGILWGLWIGSMLTNFINSLYIGKAEKRKLLFEARTKAYGQLIWKIQNSLLPDLFEIESHMRNYEFNIIFSEAVLLSSKELYLALKDYKIIIGKSFEEIQKIKDWHKNNENDDIKIIRSNLLEKNVQIIKLMREDLYLI